VIRRLWATLAVLALIVMTGFVPARALTATNQAKTLGVTETLYITYNGGTCNGFDKWKITGLSIKVTRTGTQQVPYVHTGAEEVGGDCTGVATSVRKTYTFNSPAFGTKLSIPNFPSWQFVTREAPIFTSGGYAHLHVQLGPPSFSKGTACAYVLFNGSLTCHDF
jgi:hypothetical protein